MILILFFLNPEISRKLLMLKKGSFTQIEIEIDNPSNVDQSQKFINNYLLGINKNLYSVSWKQNNSSLINALNIEKKCYVFNSSFDYFNCFYEYYFWTSYLCERKK